MPSASTRSVASTSSPRSRNRATRASPRPDAAPVTRTRLLTRRDFPSSTLAITLRCTSSGPSASRSERAPTQADASGKSSVMPAPPWSWIGHVDDVEGHGGHLHLDLAHRGVAPRGYMPWSSSHAACMTSRRERLMAIRASAMRSRLPPRLAIGLPKAVRLERAPAGELERPLGETDGAHAVVHAARAEPALGDLEGATRAEQDVRRRHPDVGEGHLAVARAARRSSPWW